MPCYIILHNVPKSNNVQIDLFTYPIEGEFRGFREVTARLHYVSLKTRNGYAIFWCYLKQNEMIVKVFNHNTQEFEDHDPEDAAHSKELASLGAMDNDMIPYEFMRSATWLLLINDIKHRHFPVTLHSEEPSTPAATLSTESVPADRRLDNKSAFEKALFDTHGGDSSAFLTEFQFAFVRWFVSELDNLDIEALNRWRYLVEAICNAEISSLAKAADMIATLVGNLITQFESVDDSLLNSDDPLVSPVRHLAQKLIDCDLKSFVKKGHQLQDYLSRRWNLT